MMRGSDSTTAMSSRRPPMTAGPMLRKRRFLSALSYGDCAKAPVANPENASTAAKMEIGDSFLECMTVFLNRSYCTSGEGRSSGWWRWEEGIVRRRAGRDGVGFVEGACAAGGQRDQGVARRRGRLPHIGKWVRFGDGIWFSCFGLRRQIGFVWCFFHFGFLELGAQGAEAFELLDGAAVVALGLGLIAEEEGPGVGPLGEAVKALGDGEVVFLAEGPAKTRYAKYIIALV